jgi:hypothetical protein
MLPKTDKSSRTTKKSDSMLLLEPQSVVHTESQSTDDVTMSEVDVLDDGALETQDSLNWEETQLVDASAIL